MYLHSSVSTVPVQAQPVFSRKVQNWERKLTTNLRSRLGLMEMGRFSNEPLRVLVRLEQPMTEALKEALLALSVEGDFREGSPRKTIGLTVDHWSKISDIAKLDDVFAISLSERLQNNDNFVTTVSNEKKHQLKVY